MEKRYLQLCHFCLKWMTQLSKRTICTEQQRRQVSSNLKEDHRKITWPNCTYVVGS